MVTYNAQLDLIFAALSDSTRRGMLAQLADGEMNISALAEPHNMSRPAVSKHLRVLEKAGLVERSRRGRDHFIRVNPAPAHEAGRWIAHYAHIWQRQFDRVDAYLKSTKGKTS